MNSLLVERYRVDIQTWWRYIHHVADCMQSPPGFCPVPVTTRDVYLDPLGGCFESALSLVSIRAAVDITYPPQAHATG